MIIKLENEELIKGKEILTDLGYSVEIGATHLFIKIDNTDYFAAKELERTLEEISGCSVWVTGV